MSTHHLDDYLGRVDAEYLIDGDRPETMTDLLMRYVKLEINAYPPHPQTTNQAFVRGVDWLNDLSPKTGYTPEMAEALKYLVAWCDEMEEWYYRNKRSSDG
jgi:hypothetical protein